MKTKIGGLENVEFQIVLQIVGLSISIIILIVIIYIIAKLLKK